jgi:hypothetical protein
MIELRRIVYGLLHPLCGNLYYQEALQESSYPYMTFSFPSTGRAYKEQVVYEVEIALYDTAKTGYNASSEIDRLTDNVIMSMDYKTGYSNGLHAWFKLEQRTELPFPDGTTMKGRLLRFTATTYREI